MQPQHPKAPLAATNSTQHKSGLSNWGGFSPAAWFQPAGKAGGHFQCSAHCRLTFVISELILQGMGEDYPGKLGKFWAWVWQRISHSPAFNHLNSEHWQYFWSDFSPCWARKMLFCYLCSLFTGRDWNFNGFLPDGPNFSILRAKYFYLWSFHWPKWSQNAHNPLFLQGLASACRKH